jgi:hypothetical protein
MRDRRYIARLKLSFVFVPILKNIANRIRAYIPRRANHNVEKPGFKWNTEADEMRGFLSFTDQETPKSRSFRWCCIYYSQKYSLRKHIPFLQVALKV